MENTDLFKMFGLSEPTPFSTDLSIHVGEPKNVVRLIIKHHLQKLGFANVKTDKDGYASLTELRLRPVHIALESDDLEFVNGYDMLKELSEDNYLYRPAFVLISKAINKGELMYAIEVGMDDLLVRPIAQSDLMLKIRNAYSAFISPKNPERIFEFAKSKMRDKEYDEAFKVYEELLKVSQKVARPPVGMARILLIKNQLEEALKYATLGIERNENYVHAYVVRAEIYASMNEQEKSLEDLKKAVAISPLNIVRYESCTEVLLKQNKIDECIEILSIATSLGLKHHYIIERLGFCYFSKKDYINALKFLKEAVHLDPKNVSYANSLAICYRDTKDYEKAVQTYNQILKKHHNNHLVLFNKAVTLILWEKKEEAIKILRRIVKIDPNYMKAKDKLTELGASFKE